MTYTRLILLACACTLTGVQARAAQQSLEVFGGFSFANMKLDNTYNNAYNSQKTNGWNTSVTTFPTYRLGITADFAGFYFTLNPSATGGSTSGTSLPAASIRQYSFLAGPQFRLLRTERVDTSVKALFGAARVYAPSPVAGVTQSSVDETAFASLIGTNFDVNIGRRMALRFSPGLYLTQYGGETQKNFRFSVGPVFRFGSGER